MMYIGLDVHARTFAMAVVNGRGEIMFEQQWATSSENLIEAVKAVGGRKRVVLEESTLASWVYRLLKPHADEVVVAEPWHNRLIGEDEKLDDQEAARKLARLLRSGDIHAVHHTDDLDRQVFKELVLFYHDSVKASTRCKNRLKSKFAQHGVRCLSGELYRADDRKRWREQLPAAGTRCQADLLWECLDQAEERRAELKRMVGRQARSFEPIRRFLAVPGIGLIRAATFYAIVDTPHRFATRSKLWVYCGIGLVSRKSGQKRGPVHLTRHGNPRLKDVFKGAAVTAIAAGDNRFAAQYQRLTLNGRAPEMARLTVARSIVSTMYAMWLRGTPYRPRQEGDLRPWPAAPTAEPTA